MRWKGYMAEEDSWEREANLKNAKEAVKEYEKEYSREERRIEEEYKEMPGRFDREYLKKLERNWRKWKGVKFF